MGAKFAPSLANLFMALWEEDVIYPSQRPELCLWARYIDDILLWKGDEETLHEFMATRNNNERGIVLTYEISTVSIQFLDLEISIVDRRNVTTTYFKPTDRNGYISTDSCHYGPWLESVPRSQLLRIRRNCSTSGDFVKQAHFLKERFVAKGYQPSVIDQEITRISGIDQDTLITERPKLTPDDRFKWSMFTQFSIQHRQIKHILNRHWRVLKSDPVLGPVLPINAGVTFRGAPSLRDHISHNVIEPPNKTSFFPEAKGYYPRKRCNVCMYNLCGRKKSETFQSSVTSIIYHMKHFTTCATRFIVYLITCPCNRQYVGRTIRAFSTRANEHITAIKLGRTNHSVPWHFLEHHDKNPRGTKFQIIDKFIPHWRGGLRIRGVSQLETFWIFQLKSYFPHGLNVEWDLNVFINKS